MSEDPDKFKPHKSMNNIEMCHEQGNPAINADDPECKVIRIVWPNWVIDRLTVATDQVTRTWPDGRVETFACDSEADTSPASFCIRAPRPANLDLDPAALPEGW